MRDSSFAAQFQEGMRSALDGYFNQVMPDLSRLAEHIALQQGGMSSVQNLQDAAAIVWGPMQNDPEMSDQFKALGAQLLQEAVPVAAEEARQQGRLLVDLDL